MLPLVELRRDMNGEGSSNPTIHSGLALTARLTRVTREDGGCQGSYSLLSK